MNGSDVAEVLASTGFSLSPKVTGFENREFTHISDVWNLTEASLFFCGEKKFWTQFRAKDHYLKTFVLFSKKFYDSMEEEILKENLDFAVIDNLPLAMSALSKSFYDSVVKGDNDEVDGRQLGTCEIHPSVVIAQNVFLGAHVKIESDVKIYPGTVISSHCTIKSGTTLFPNVTLMPRTSIGKNCRIHSGTVIGADGFGYHFHEGSHHKIWHMGGVSIGDEVEVGSNVSIDQGTFSPTLIGRGAKIDNLVQVAHNCRVGDGVILCGQVGLAGSVKLGAFTVIGGGACLAPDIEVGDAVQIGGMAGVTGNVASKEAIAGFPARPVREWLKGVAQIRKLALNK